MNTLKKRGGGEADLRNGFTLTFSFERAGTSVITIATLAEEILLWPVEGERFIAYFTDSREEHARRFASLIAAVTGMKFGRSEKSTSSTAVFQFT